MAINNIKDLALALKAAPSGLTIQQIMALDSASTVCAYPMASIQQIRALGYPLVITTDGTGAAQYKISA